MKKLQRNFFTRSTLTVAKNFLGMFISRVWRGEKIVGKIVEVEMYIGPNDKASHAYMGKITKRNQAEYLVGGHIYIYLCYGMHWQFNITTEGGGNPACILIRALEPVIDSKNSKFQDLSSKEIVNLANGPGKLCRYLKLNKSFYGEDLIKSQRIWFSTPPANNGKEMIRIKKSGIIATPRIRIDYAGEYWAKKPWRFYIKDNPFVSKK